MEVFYLFTFLFINSITSMSIRQDECNKCNLNGFFGPSNGYGCFITGNVTICTCPDSLLSTRDRPCRICERAGICGLPDALCSEQSSSFALNNQSAYFACFCPSGSFQIGKSCQQETTLPTISTISTTSTSTTTTTSPTTSTSATTSTVNACRNRSSVKSVSFKSLLFVVFVYLINK